MAEGFQRSIETGAILGVLVLLLALTGIALSPSLLNAQSNGLYAAHVVLGLLFIAALVWHYVPLLRKTFTRLDSAFLLAVAVAEIYTGIALWRHFYVPLPKAVAVFVHLGLTAVILAPIATHSIRGTRKWWARRQADRAVLARETPQRAFAIASAASRRMFLRLAAYTAAGVALAYAFGEATTQELGAWRVNSIGRTPDITKESWQLRVTGLVDRPITLTWGQLMAMRQKELHFVHHCVEGWVYEDTFVGVPLPDIIQAAGGVKAGARMLIFKSPETSQHMFTRGQQYTTNFPVEDGMHDDVLLVHKAHGEDLPPIHGFPVRLMTPRKWGFKACKWLTEIEVSADPNYKGYWERAGYHNDGDYPGPIWA